MELSDLLAGQTLRTLSPDAPLDSALDLFRSEGLSAVPLVDAQGRLVGLVTSGSLLLAVQGDLPPELLAPLDAAGAASSTPASLVRLGDLPTRPPLLARPEDGARLAARRLLAAKQHHLVVVDDEQRPLAVLSSQDFVRLAAFAPNPPPPSNDFHAEAWFQHVRLQHAELDACTDRLRALSCAPLDCLPPERYRALLQRELGAFAELLQMHLAYEEEGGYLGDLAGEEPERRALVERLLADHAELRAALEHLRGPEANERALLEERSGVARLLDALERHDAAESEFLGA